MSNESENHINILVLFSLNRGVLAYDFFFENFNEVLREEYSEKYNLYTDYLDVGRFPDMNYMEYLFKNLNEKYENINLDLFVCVGPRIVPLLERYAADYFMELPTISTDLMNPFDDGQKFKLNNKTTEILISLNPRKNFELASSLFPGRDNFFVISGSADVDNFFSRVVLDAAEKYNHGIKTHSLSDLTIEGLIDTVSKLPEKSIIIMTSYTSDSKNIAYNTAEAIRLISKKTDIPIFTILDTPIKEGALGGYVSSMRIVGTQAGKTAVEILNGKSPSEIHVNPEDLNEFIFDSREIERFGLNDSDLIPGGSNILFEEKDFLERYKWILAAGISFLLIQTLLIFNLIRLNNKQKSITRQLVETENRYRELVREDRLLRMSELTASLSHELNQPIAAILSTAQAGIRYLNSERSNPDLMREILDNIVEDDKRAASIISSVRSLMKLERREKEKADLNNIIKEVILIFKSEAIKRNIKFSAKLLNDPVYIEADPIQIQQVLLNLFFNASHAMESNETADKIIELSENLNGESVIVSVSDNGSGINKEIRENLFKPFATSREKGLGIGLAVSRSIIESHNGKIWGENNPGRGAKFYFELRRITSG